MGKPSIEAINEVFNTAPRDGNEKSNIWINRAEEKLLGEMLDDYATSICIDGPTGAGKTSLAITTLERKKIKYMLIQITSNTTWEQFCRKLLEAKINNNSTFEFGLDTGMDKGLPLFKLSFGFKSTNNEIDNIEFEEKLINRMTDDSICKFLYDNKLTLVIDDFERTKNSEIFNNVAEMCKLLTVTYRSKLTKLVIIGTDEIYYNLRTFNKSLERRITELSMGTIQKRIESWNFLISGFNKLNLSTPESDYIKGYGGITKEDLKECSIACFEAADGLLKAINYLGKELAKSATVSSGRISKTTMKRVSKKMVEENLKSYSKDFPAIMALINRNQITKGVIVYLFSKGIGRIHNWQDIIDSFETNIDQDQIENAISDLIVGKFLTRTGGNGEVLYVTSPTFAHTIGIAVTCSDKYRIPRVFKEDDKQIVLPLFGKKD